MGVQGITFSEDGYIYIAWYTAYENHLIGETIEWSNYLRVYNALTGTFLYNNEYDFEGILDEIEGLSIHPSGVLYVAVCDHDIFEKDDFMIHAFE